jgi:hypothetical protein
MSELGVCMKCGRHAQTTAPCPFCGALVLLLPPPYTALRIAHAPSSHGWIWLVLAIGVLAIGSLTLVIAALKR